MPHMQCMFQIKRQAGHGQENLFLIGITDVGISTQGLAGRY